MIRTRHHQPIRRRTILSAVLAPWWGHAAMSAEGQSAMRLPAAIGDTVRWPTVRLLDGSPIAPTHWQGQAAVIVFFSTTCPFCRRHNQHLNRLAAQAGAMPLKVLGVAQDTDPHSVRRYLARERLAFAVTLDEPAMRQALTLRRSVPLTCAIDRQGVLRELIPGEMFEADVMGLAKWSRA